MTDETPSTPAVTPLVVDAIGFAALIDVSVREVHRLDSMGGIPAPVRFGKCKRWVRLEIEDWLNVGAPSRREWNAMRRPPA